MRKLFLALIMLLPLGALAQIAIIPQPNKIEMAPKEGYYTLSPKDKIVVATDNQKLNEVALYFNTKIKMATGFTLPLVTKGRGIRLALDKSLPTEGYTLKSSKNGIEITGGSASGVFYGVQSLLQLLPKQIKSNTIQSNVWSVPYLRIEDAPRFAWRGMMLDVSRYFFTKQEVMSYIDQMAEYKMNVFHWHLTDDQGWRIEIKSLPELTEKGSMRAARIGDWWSFERPTKEEPKTYGGYYTQQDIKEVVAYAAERFITIMPEIDVPGHSLAALVAFPELACLKAPEAVNVGNKFYGIDENSLCAGNPKSYELMEKVLREVAELFPCQYIHIGGDECFKGFWTKCPKCQAMMAKQGLKNVNELQSYFIRQMEKILQSNGKRLVGWDEISEGGLAAEATVMSWRGMQGGIDAAKEGHHVIMTPNNHCYLDLYQGETSVEPTTYSMCRLSDSYAFEPVPDGVAPELILGGQGNLWAESVPNFRHAEYMTWPRGWALAEVLWSKKENRDWKGFVAKLEPHFERADMAQTKYARSVYNAIVTPFTDTLAKCVKIELGKEINNIDIYYSFDGSFPDNYSSKYVGEPLTIPRNATRIIIATYIGSRPVGERISIETKDIISRASSVRRTSILD
ncbi:MAG: family 20 glycosylhydrolase [Mucinivorans sp.]